MRVLVVGATGATGCLVVSQLLAAKAHVTVIVRSRQRMLDLLNNPDDSIRLTIVEGTVLDMSEAELQQKMTTPEQRQSPFDAIVSCLGHNLTFRGLFGHPRRLVSETVERLIQNDNICSKTATQFILMNSDGVFIEGTDDLRTRSEQCIIFLLRHLIAPHADNEAAAAYLMTQEKKQQYSNWVVVRPTDLVDPKPEEDACTSYVVYDKPVGSLFGGGQVSRANTARFMVDLLTNKEMFAKYKGKFPVVHDTTSKANAS